MAELLFMRHAESEANVRNILASRLDIPLTERGQAEARRLAADLIEAGLRPDRVIASPLLRARQTAEPCALAAGLSLETDARLTEQHLGRFSGLDYATVERDPAYLRDRTKRWDWVPEGGGESYRMIAERVRPFLEQPFLAGPGTVLVVTHAVTLRLLRAWVEGTLPRYPEKIAANGEILRVFFAGLGRAHTVTSLFSGEPHSPSHRA